MKDQVPELFAETIELLKPHIGELIMLNLNPRSVDPAIAGKVAMHSLRLALIIVTTALSKEGNATFEAEAKKIEEHRRGRN